MPTDYASRPPEAVRRKDRARTEDSWIRDFLAGAPVGVTATVQDGRPFMNSNTFVYDEETHAIYFHTARVGRTRANVERSRTVSFHAFTMGRLLPAEVAKEFSVEYAGVTVFGEAFLVDDPVEAKRVLQLLLDKYFGHLEPGLKRAHLDVVQRHLGQHGNERIVQGFLLRGDVRVGGLDGAPRAAEHIELPARIEAGGIERRGVAAPARAQVGQGFAERLVDDDGPAAAVAGAFHRRAAAAAAQQLQQAGMQQQQAPPPPAPPSEESVRLLTDMGFARERAEAALARSGGDVNAATLLLLQENSG